MSDSSKTKKGVSRRTFLKTASAAAGLAAGSGAITGFPTIWAQNPITLRQFGTGVSNINAIADRSGRSPKTISRQKAEAMRKLGLQTNQELYDYLQTRRD